MRSRKALPLFYLVLLPLVWMGTASGHGRKKSSSIPFMSLTFKRTVKNQIVPVPESSVPNSLHHVLLGVDGMLYASSFITNEVYRAVVDERGAWQWFRVVSKGTGVDGPTGLAVDKDLRLYVASFGTDQILRYDTVTGSLIDIFINDEEGKLDCPEGLLLLEDRLLVASFLNDRVVSYRLDGSFQEIFSAGWYMDGPQVMLFHPKTNSIFISSYHRDKIVKVDATTGKKQGEFGGKELSRPVGLAAAPDDTVLCSSHKSNEILRYNASTGHGLWAPTGIAMSSASGDDI
ncbi:hypothetical protein GUITHDRAFT_132857 [Guillardia theta CCMP2712]|uniref:SMP-30/Gluconolactonase/LRE-like region domain-containing protein n=1 Tax=Guillardia theta (strain CCMP2712) TaxID=905079 RepID=L1K0C8_GUITC|nr:hypothetical protein GUITHDRAFT_132857 [Guillardia theta CCMP2712]EKX53808.1 hypothetical protein GUITHDRAFT_132857 [Guillardia theta CCMP2712]|eukprot:XP_005840788.1 hypothetical protein GUITHDRAFT_132857 [Guillardia theta CCMP2712]